MKKLKFPLFLLIVLTLLSFVKEPNPVLGRWEYRGKYNNDSFQVVYIFRADSSVEGVLNGKSFASGRYFMKGDTMFIADPGCGADYWGQYQISFYGDDSIKFQPISDTCAGRREANDGRTMIKLKNK